jgi:hypothetical protein
MDPRVGRPFPKEKGADGRCKIISVDAYLTSLCTILLRDLAGIGSAPQIIEMIAEQNGFGPKTPFWECARGKLAFAQSAVLLRSSYTHKNCVNLARKNARRQGPE